MSFGTSRRTAGHWRFCCFRYWLGVVGFLRFFIGMLPFVNVTAALARLRRLRENVLDCLHLPVMPLGLDALHCVHDLGLKARVIEHIRLVRVDVDRLLSAPNSDPVAAP